MSGATRDEPLAHPRYRPDIDGLRAVAVLSVVLFHAAPALLPGGFIGVDIFFVISGYLIGSIILGELDTRTFSFAHFYARRVKRIFPALILMMAACYAFGWFNLLDTEFMALGKHIAAGAGFVSNLALWREAGYFDASAATKPLLHLWSLGVEEQFYIVWPVLLWALYRLRINPLIGIVAIGLGSFAWNIVTVGVNPTADFYSPLTRFWELMIGCLLAYRHLYRHWQAPAGAARFVVAPRIGGHRAADLRAWTGCALLVAGVALLRGDQAFPGWAALLPTLGAYLLIDSPAAWLNRRLLATRPMVGIGLISFPLYLWHWPLLAYARILESDTPAPSSRAAMVLAAFVLAWLTYYCVERPVRRTRSRVGAAALLTLLVLLMAALGVQGYNTYRREGLPFRFAKLLTQFTHIDADAGPSAWRSDRCFLQSPGVNDFDAQCTDQPEAPTSPTPATPSTSATSGAVSPTDTPLVFLWGDSHAAALYPGLRALQQAYTFRVAQYTVSACGPWLGADASSPRCALLQQKAFEVLKRVHPHLVILTADWGDTSVPKIANTIATLRAAGLQDSEIEIVGPVARWRDTLPKVYWAYWRKYGQVLPDHTRFRLDPTMDPVDRQLAALAAQLHIRYVSAYRAQCNAQGCETRFGPGKGQITLFDDTHLTQSGAVSLLQTLAPQMMDGRIAPRGNGHQADAAAR